MSINELKQRVLEANLDLVKKNLVISTWGNVSGFDEESGLVVIKASGIHYEDMTTDHMIVVDLNGNVVEGRFTPSTDTPTHLVIYNAYKDEGIRGIVHTHAQYSTMWAQSGNDIPCFGTTHSDYFYGDIPNTRTMTEQEIATNYEKNTGDVIIETLNGYDCKRMSAVLVHSHGPFSWGKSPEEAVLHSQVLEYIAKMAFDNVVMSQGKCERIQQILLDKHYNRKFGPNAYYGQKV